MQVKLPDGSVLVTGRCSRDAEFKRVGEKDSRMCRVGLAVGKRPDPENPTGEPITAWANVVAWHDLASVLSPARKGDAVLVVGRLKQREHDGKTYTDLEAEFVSVASSHPAAPPCDAVPTRSVPDDPFSDLDDDDGDLPF